MNFLLDAQLPRRLAVRLRELGHDALHTLDLPRANQTTDLEISELSARGAEIEYREKRGRVTEPILFPCRPIPEAWIVRGHTQDELQRWATSLRFFRFCRAFGGHANDGDVFEVLIQFQSEHDLREICSLLGLRLNPLPAHSPCPVPGRGYSAEEFSKFRSRIQNLTHLGQPGWCQVNGIPAFVWVDENGLRICFAGGAGDPYQVTEQDFENALSAEGLLEPLRGRVVDPPRDNPGCVCPKFYPAFWVG